MKSVGELLKKQREQLHYSIKHVSFATKIKEEYIEFIEANAFEKLPSPVSTQGYIDSLSTFVGLQPEAMLALFRRDFKFNSETTYPLTVVERKKQRQQQATVSIIASIFALFFIVIGGYGFWTYQRVRQAPMLTVSSPKESEKVVSPLVVRGNTTSDAVVEIDGQAVGVTQDGEFVTQLELLPGSHVITITSKNRYGKQTTNQVMVTVEK